MNKNSRPPIQFTKLTQEDMALHKESYVCLLLTDTGYLSKKGKELHEAMQLFYEAFK